MRLIALAVANPLTIPTRSAGSQTSSSHAATVKTSRLALDGMRGEEAGKGATGRDEVGQRPCGDHFGAAGGEIGHGDGQPGIVGDVGLEAGLRVKKRGPGRLGAAQGSSVSDEAHDEED